MVLSYVTTMPHRTGAVLRSHHAILFGMILGWLIYNICGHDGRLVGIGLGQHCTVLCNNYDTLNGMSLGRHYFV